MQHGQQMLEARAPHHCRETPKEALAKLYPWSVSFQHKQAALSKSSRSTPMAKACLQCCSAEGIHLSPKAQSEYCHLMPPVHCSGNRTAMQECQMVWYSADSSEQQAQLACQLQGDVTDGTQFSYLQEQCSEGYKGRLCSSCNQGYGSSGEPPLYP